MSIAVTIKAILLPRDPAPSKVATITISFEIKPAVIGIPPSDSRAIIQNIQVVNTSGSKTVDFYIYDASANVTYLAAHGSITGPTTCNFAKGPIVLEENDIISAQSS